MVIESHCNPTLANCGWTAVAVSVLKRHVQESTLKVVIGTLAVITYFKSIEQVVQVKY